jgi:hypothetical protein
VGRNQLYSSACPGNAVKLTHDVQRIADMLNDVAADDFIEPIVREGVGYVVKIVYDVGGGARVYIHSDSAHNFVLSATDVKYTAETSKSIGADSLLRIHSHPMR